MSVEDIWISFKNLIEQGISKFIPTKFIREKRSLPWITIKIKRLIRKRDKLFRLSKHAGMHHLAKKTPSLKTFNKTRNQNILYKLLGEHLRH